MNETDSSKRAVAADADGGPSGWLARAPLRSKLTLMISVTAGLALLLAVLLGLMQERDRHETSQRARLSSLAQIIGQNSQAAILFQDTPAMERSLALLEQDPSILMAALYDTSGNRIASYRRDERWLTPVRVPVRDTEGQNADYNWLSRVISGSGQEVGAIWLAADDAAWQARLQSSIQQALAIFVTLVLLVILVSVRLQRAITRPVEDLQRTIQRIIDNHDYSLRAKTLSEDELADLVRGFNHMLGEIERRTNELRAQIAIRHNAEALLSEQKGALQRAHDELEARVADRTRQLEHALDLVSHTDQAKTRFLSRIGDELRTPLDQIIGLANHLQEGYPDNGLNAESCNDSNRIADIARRLLALIEEVMIYSDLDAGRIQPQRREFPVRDLVVRCIGEQSALVEAAGNAIVNEVRDTIGNIQSDPEVLRQILVSLIGNACRFTTKGAIRIRGRRYVDELQAEWIMLAVTDSGVGIEPAALEHIFEPFQAPDVRGKRKPGGTGLGLAIVQKNARLLGGLVDVESAPGQGCTFTVHLPALLPSAQGSDAVTESPAVRDLTLITVSGDGPALRVLQQHAAAHGVALRTAGNMNELATLLGLARPVAVIIDLNLDDGAGWRIYRDLKSRAEYFDVPMLLGALDSNNQNPSPEPMPRIRKPVQQAELHAALGRCCPEGRALSILIMEPDNQARASLGGLLKESGHHAIEAENTPIGLALGRETFPDLILLDLELLCNDGPNPLALMRADERLAELPVVLVSRCRDTYDENGGLATFRNDSLFPDGIHPQRAIERLAATIGLQQSR